MLDWLGLDDISHACGVQCVYACKTSTSDPLHVAENASTGFPQLGLYRLFIDFVKWL